MCPISSRTHAPNLNALCRKAREPHVWQGCVVTGGQYVPGLFSHVGVQTLKHPASLSDWVFRYGVRLT